jgi:flagellar biosynthesis/type III secretory pathway protein FliH
MKIFNLLCALILVCGSTLAQDPNALLKEVRLKLEKVTDYSAQVHIHADIPMI